MDNVLDLGSFMQNYYKTNVEGGAGEIWISYHWNKMCFFIFFQPGCSSEMTKPSSSRSKRWVGLKLIVDNLVFCLMLRSVQKQMCFTPYLTLQNYELTIFCRPVIGRWHIKFQNSALCIQLLYECFVIVLCVHLQSLGVVLILQVFGFPVLLLLNFFSRKEVGNSDFLNENAAQHESCLHCTDVYC